jgi:hypothetical protein
MKVFDSSECEEEKRLVVSQFIAMLIPPLSLGPNIVAIPGI